jgi:hypothetical protein
MNGVELYPLLNLDKNSEFQISIDEKIYYAGTVTSPMPYSVS